MKSICLFLENQKIIKREETENYTIKDYKNPPEKDIQKDKDDKLKYRRKVFYDKNGKKNILTLAIMNKSGKMDGMTKVTSKWKEKD